MRKEYLAICHGDPGFDTVVDAPLYRRSSGKVGAVDKMDAETFGAKAAKTRVRNVATAAGGWVLGWVGGSVGLWVGGWMGVWVVGVGGRDRWKWSGPFVNPFPTRKMILV